MLKKDIEVGQHYRIANAKHAGGWYLRDPLHNCERRLYNRQIPYQHRAVANCNMPSIGSILLATDKGPSYYFVFKVLQWRDGSTPDQEYFLTAEYHTGVEPASKKQYSPRQLRAADLKRQENKLQEHRKDLIEKKQKLEDQIAYVEERITAMAGRIEKLEMYTSDAEELTALANELATSDDPERIAELLKTRVQEMAVS